MNKIRVFIVDDSAVMRQVLGEVIESDPQLTVCGSAPDPLIAERKMVKDWPDVVVLDIAMPKMDGIAFLRHIMSTHPTPIVICSAKTEADPQLSLEALSSGAIEVINKPQSQLNDYLHSQQVVVILNAIKQAAKAKVKTLKYIGEHSYRTHNNADVVLDYKSCSPTEGADKVIVIGASTGGTEAVRHFLHHTPISGPPIVVVQHMPEKFTRAFAMRLNNEIEQTVVEASEGVELKAGWVYIAPGGVHTLLKRKQTHYYLELKDGPLVSRHKPSVDVLFRSAAKAAGRDAIGVILTGMGDDGAQGMLELHHAGARTFAQSEASCLIYGMPKEAIEKGGVDGVYALELLPYQVIKSLEAR
ncbi:chemotaxis response regulator protein-glutamate methylesterase [Vibrio aquaticus]|uniref:Protein-glutamate methylesterase/protein-glutamine glutaminase n=1 Tax=Vibrio aquaticus TaxID=2496559 RepID=A0A3S0MJU4_9VIBR|nr:chemotaxis response regulator protein-glutamate methylesterase [Vibrio aquaticus]RTZ16581.1 chemotaxis response regulator protein-glutamate methylesterase [Vibrio aquaticus]